MAIEIKENNFRDSYMAMKKWLQNRNLGKNIGENLKSHGYKAVAIYGADDLSDMLIHEIKDTDIAVSYLIGKNGESRQEDEVPVVLFHDIAKQKEVDVILVPPNIDYESVNRKLLENYIALPTLWIRDLVYEM